jgi:MFS family permease
MELPSGALADLIGRKHTIFLGFFAGAISFLLFPFGSTFNYFLILALLVGISDAFRSGAEEAIIYDTLIETDNESNFKSINANGNLIYQAGLIIATTLGGFIYSVNQYAPYIIYGISLFVGSLIVILYQEPHIDSAIFSVKNYLHQITTGSKEIFKDAYTKYISLFYIFVGGIAWSSTLYFNAYMLVDLGFSDSMRGILDAGMRLINVVLITLVLKNEKIFNQSRTILFFPIIMLFGYLPGALVQGFVGLPFIQAVMIATTARWIILTPLTNQAYSSKYRATAISFLSLLIGFVYIGLTTASAVIIPTYGIKVMYSLLGFITLATVVPLAIKLLPYQSK